MVNKSSAADLLGEWIAAEGLSRAEAARRLGVTATALYYWLSGRTLPSEPSRRDIEAAAGIAPDCWGFRDRRGSRTPHKRPGVVDGPEASTLAVPENDHH